MTLASPESTGHAGPFFEQHVDAAFLALLLVGGVPPFILGAEVTEVHLQSKHLDWAIDDLLVVGVGTDGRQRRAALSVKRSFTMAKTNPECVDVFTKAWTDFKAASFNTDYDILGLVTRPGSDTLMRGLRVLLETARASSNGGDLMRRLALPHYRDKHAQTYGRTIREIIEGAHECKLTDDELQRFLASFDFACLDLNTPSSTTEALLLSLLRACAAPGEPTSVGTDAWNTLLSTVSSEAPTARSLRRTDLPLGLCQRFRVGGTYIGRLLEPFDEMTRTVCNGVDTAIAGYHEPRLELEQHAIELLDSNTVLLIGGLAGDGKSAVTKAVFEALGRGHFALAMRAEMLARPSASEAFVAMGTSIRNLRDVMALHTLKILWIDGVERLLEKPLPEREGFNDIMRLLRQDPGWRIIITCRAYSLETFKAAFLDRFDIESTTLVIPPLSSEQLDAIATRVPQLSRPLSNPQLRSLLANPFLLKMAAKLEWNPSHPLPLTEREFRAQVWKQVIRRDDDTIDGMPLRRGMTYMQVALKRAQSLDAFVDAQNLDPAAVLKLKGDTLLFESDDGHGQYAPSHDVLEDWAVLEWLDREYNSAQRSWWKFIGALGTHPAIRRTFRVWLAERIETDPGMSMSTASLIVDAAFPRHWTDDALVALLRSRDPGPFFDKHERVLLQTNAQLLRRAVHLTRVACQQSLTQSPDGIASNAQRPVGLVWQRLVEFAAAHLDEIVPHCAPLLLGLLADWCGCVTMRDPYPAGAAAVGAIACRLLDGVDIHGHPRNTDVIILLTILLRIPRETESRIRAIATRYTHDRFSDEAPFVKLVLSHLHGGPLCRDFPDITIAVTRRLLAPPSPRTKKPGPFAGRLTQAQSFGLAERHAHYGHPPSALHGPFLILLRLHPADGVRLIVDTINRCSTAYLDSLNDGDTHDLEFHFDLPGGHRLSHRGDGHLWAMHRTKCGPNILCSMLMALESWLLDIGDHHWTDCLRELVSRIMTEGTSLALSAVVASVVMAHPGQLGDFAIAFLRNPILYRFDRDRVLGDCTPTDQLIARAFPPLSSESGLFLRERIEAAERSHRRSHFELLAWQLQATSLREAMLNVLDEHLAALPGEAERDDADRVWYLALHRMDSRNVAIRTETDGRDTLLVSLPPADVQAVVERERPGIEVRQRGAAVYLWAKSRYGREDDPVQATADWHTQLEFVNTHPPEPFFDARLIVSVVCLRDFYERMTPDERAWCIDTVCTVFAGSTSHDDISRSDPTSGVGEAALELGSMLVKIKNAEQRERLEIALTSALLADEYEISRRAAIGIGRDLWKYDRELAVALATALDYNTRHEFEMSMSLRRMSPSDERDIAGAEEARAQFKVEALRIVADRRVDLAQLLRGEYWKNPARVIVRELAEMFCFQADDLDAVAFVTNLSEQLRATWLADRHGQGVREEVAGFDYETETFVADVVCLFALGLGEQQAADLLAPYRELACSYPEEVAKLLRQLAVKECDRFRPQVFWRLWSHLSDALIEWANATVNASHTVLDAIAEALFLDLHWKETTTTWRSLAGHEADVANAFSRFRLCKEGVEKFATFLSTIGSGLLPDVLPLLARRFGESAATLSGRTVTLLERSLASLVYTGAPRIRQESDLREATLVVLDALIEAGSSKAYRMRDDFVTPLRVEAGRYQ